MPSPQKWGLQLPKPKRVLKPVLSTLDENANDFKCEENMEVKSSGLSRIKSETIALQEQALIEDPNIFDYDCALESMPEQAASSSVNKKPKYMESLLKRAAERKLERERYALLRVQKEREKEDPAYSEKEQFITGAYKRKLMALEQNRIADPQDSNTSPQSRDMSDFCKNILDKKHGHKR